ncbi:MAG: MATE family efflux transporter [Corallococcus sp.]|nr:MATE family efflux transporter [Corallococcus sp.]MCM1359753.1 MATE family efflux transporter [Corallococcus sp.]MCM1395721.1 MATE family efflux transporter [Corallococcus sp.]
MEENNVKSQNAFLGKEKVGKLLLKFSLPCVLSLIIQALYNLVDQIFIGHSPALGAIGNAATGIVYPLTVIALGLGLWLGDGAAACMSINQGKQDTESSAKSIGTALFFGTVFGAILTIITLCLNVQILSAIGASGDILDASVEYSLFIAIGFIFFILACVLNPIIRADGSPKFAMLAMAVGAVINIALDPVFIYVADMGMTGAALATFLGQTITFILHVAYLFKSKTFKLKWKDFIPNFGLLGKLLKYGISSFLTQLAIVIISIVNNALLKVYSAANGYDPQITQGVLTLAFKVFGIVVSIVIGIASGGQPILGYNYGAKKYGRVKKTYKYILFATLIVGVIATVLFEACPKLFLLIFGDGGDKADKVAYAQFTVLTFRIYLGFIALTCIIKVSAIFLQSIGKPVLAAIISMCRDVIILVPAAIVMCVCGGVNLLLWSAPISDCVSFVLCVVIIWSVLKKMPKTDVDEVLQQNDGEQDLQSENAAATVNAEE